MRAGESSAWREAGAGGDFRAQHRLHGRAPEPPGGELRAVVRRIVMVRADDPMALEAVAERKRNCLLHCRMARQRQRVVQRNVAGGRIEMKHRRKYQLHRAALSARHQVDAARVAPHALFELRRRQQQYRDRGDAERKQQQVERGGQRPRAQVSKTDSRNIQSSSRF